MNTEFLQKLPFLKNVDLKDPKKKKIYAGIIALIILAMIVLAFSIYDNEKKKEQEQLAKAATEAEAAKNGMIEFPNGQNYDKSILEADDMKKAHESLSRRRGSTLADIYENNEMDCDDPMAVKDNNSETPLREDGTPMTTEELSRRRMKEALFGDNDKQDTPSSAKAEAQTAPQQQASSGNTKSLNRGKSTSAPSTPAAKKKSGASSKTGGNPATTSGATGNKKSTASTRNASNNEDQDPDNRKAVRRSGGISSLDDWGSVDGISGLDSDDQYITIDDSKPVRVMFIREQKITSGQRVSLRLLDDIAAEGILIPKNTHLSGICTIGDRLQIKIKNIEINGKILTLDYTAYDNDGNEGLYCPETAAKKATKQAGEQAMSIGQNLLNTALTGIASNIVSSGSSIVSSAKGNVTAVVNAGYTFYLLKDEF